MDVKERTQLAIKLAQTRLAAILENPKYTSILIAMITNDVSPEDLEDMISSILEYLDKTEAAG